MNHVKKRFEKAARLLGIPLHELRNDILIWTEEHKNFSKHDRTHKCPFVYNKISCKNPRTRPDIYVGGRILCNAIFPHLYKENESWACPCQRYGIPHVVKRAKEVL